MTTTSWQLVISSQSKSDQNKQGDGDSSESSARFCAGVFRAEKDQSSLVFLCYENPQKRLLRKLLLEFLIVEEIKFLESQANRARGGGGAGGGASAHPPPHFFENYKEFLRKKCFQPPTLSH